MGKGSFSTFRHLSRLPTPLRRVKCQLREKRHDRLCCDLHPFSILHDPGSVVLTVVLLLSAHITLDLYRAHSGHAVGLIGPLQLARSDNVGFEPEHADANLASFGIQSRTVDEGPKRCCDPRPQDVTGLARDALQFGHQTRDVGRGASTLSGLLSPLLDVGLCRRKLRLNFLKLRRALFDAAMDEGTRGFRRLRQVLKVGQQGLDLVVEIVALQSKMRRLALGKSDSGLVVGIANKGGDV